jgi:cytochrome c oxidase subunit III
VSREPRIAGDLSSLPDHNFGPTSLGWWGVFGFMLIEGMGFVLAIAAYFYLMPLDGAWPPHGRPPDLLWGTLFTALGVLSLVPNVWVDRAAHRKDLRKVQVGLLLMTTVGVLLLGVRAMEFTALNVHWTRNAYGSIVWAILVLHTVHTVTDVYDSGVLAAMSLRKEMTGRRMSDVSDNALYWHFIVLSWLLLYVVVYWVPRWT